MECKRSSWLLVPLVAFGCDRASHAPVEIPTHVMVEPRATGSGAAAPGGELDGGVEGEAKPAPVSASASVEDARAFLEEFLKPGADHKTLTSQLAPQPQDYARVFEGDLAKRARAHYEKFFAHPDAVIAPKDGRTTLVVFAVTTEELRADTGEAGAFPDDYRRIADRLVSGVTWFGFRFVGPEERWERSFAGMTFIDGRWVMFPKPSRIK